MQKQLPFLSLNPHNTNSNPTPHTLHWLLYKTISPFFSFHTFTQTLNSLFSLKFSKLSPHFTPKTLKFPFSMFTTLNLPTAAPLFSSPETRFSSSRRSVKAYAATATEARPYSSSAAVHPASLYEVLRVERTASLTEIKTAYRSLAKMYHPDAMIQQHHQDEEDKPEIELDSESDGRDFIEIHNAYATLSDPAARALYDLSLGNTTSQFSNQRGPFGFGVGFGFSAPNRTGFSPTRRWETDQCW